MGTYLSPNTERPNLNIVSHGIGRWEEMERDRGKASQQSSQNTHNIHQLTSLSYMATICGAPNTYNNNIKDH